MSVDESKHREIRAAKFSIERNQNEGVTLCVEAGELRLRFYIDGQWSDLLQQIYAGEGELGEMVPFEMKPISVSSLESPDKESETKTDEVPIISTNTIGAHPIPGLSRENPAYDTPLWKDAFPSLRAGADDSKNK